MRQDRLDLESYLEVREANPGKWEKDLLAHRELLDHPNVALVRGLSVILSFHTVRQSVDLSVEYQKLARQVQLILKRHGYESVAHISHRDTATKSRVKSLLRAPERFRQLDFGKDMAERDHRLLDYFVQTRAYHNVASRKKTIVLGPKGSGKSAILRACTSLPQDAHTLSLTPEHYAVDLLNSLINSQGHGAFDSRQAYKAAWKYTLLIEAFKLALAGRREVRKGPLADIHAYVQENLKQAKLDPVSRLIGYVKRIESAKLGKLEYSLQLRELKNLYEMEEINRLLPGFQSSLRSPIALFIDELDQGWNNTEGSNKFLTGLLLAVTELNSLSPLFKVIVFIRTEIFDLLSRGFAQTDKLREDVEWLDWNLHSLEDLVGRRVKASCDLPADEDTLLVTECLFEEDKQRLGMECFRYIISRTFMRPREIIQFLKLCYEEARRAEKNFLDGEVVTRAERTFSRWKFDHICSEYLNIYPGLEGVLQKFRGGGRLLTRSMLDDVLVPVILESEKGEVLRTWLGEREPEEVTEILFRINFLGAPSGVTVESVGGKYVFAFDAPETHIHHAEHFQVHPGFWAYLDLSG